MSHAVLSPSASKQWLNCPPSIRLSEKFKKEVSSYAVEGTSAHSLCEYYLKKTLGRKAIDPRKSLELYSDEMEECA